MKIEYIKGLPQPLKKSNFAEHIFNTNHTYTNFETNLEILHTNIMSSLTNILNVPLHYKTYTLFEKITYANHTDICHFNPYEPENEHHHSHQDHGANGTQKLLLHTQVREDFAL